jgi:general stress protein 26
MATEHQEDIKKVAALMKGIRFMMLTTIHPDGSLHSRPMTTQDVEFDGDLWFFTAAHAHKVDEVNRDHQVNVSFADTDKQTYISASGVATLVRDRKKIEDLWKPAYKTFFHQGLDDPELALLKVSVHTVEYWDSPSSAAGRLYSFVKAYATGDVSALGDHDTVKVD